MLEQVNQYNVEPDDWVRYRLCTGQVVEVKIKGYVNHHIYGGSQGRLFTIIHQGKLLFALPEELFELGVDEI